MHLHGIVLNVLKETPLEETVERNIAYFKKIWRGRPQTLKVITLVRNPVARALTTFMQEFYVNRITVSTSNDLKRTCK